MIVGVCGAMLAVFPLPVHAQVNGSEVPAAGPAPAYQIRLGPRHAQASPTLTTDSQTGGGYIDVQQTMPNAIVISMRGAAVAGADCKKGASASIAFELDQEFTIVSTRAGLRPPRLGLAARVVGVLDSSDKGKGCGSAEQGEACAAVLSAGESLLTVCVPPQAAAGGQKLFLNNRAGPVEVAVVPGCFALRQTFHIAATQSKSLCDKAASAADFDPKPQLDSEWAKPLKAFRAVPRDDFGFRVVLWVVEDTLPAEVEKAP
jgi:hypothetical protein